MLYGYLKHLFTKAAIYNPFFLCFYYKYHKRSTAAHVYVQMWPLTLPHFHRFVHLMRHFVCCKLKKDTQLKLVKDN